MGMCMSLRGVPASVVMTSTWHKVAGPMAELMERGRAGEFPVSSFCMFEVLERCPAERSGKHLEKCPECPIVKWCHQGKEEHPSGLPKAKRSDGHYTIDSLIQKVRSVSPRVFASDYLCLGPKAAGVWFSTFDERNVHVSAEFDPALPVHLSVDSGVFTGAVFMQYRQAGPDHYVNVFDDYLAEGQAAETAAALLLAQLIARCGFHPRRVSTDSAGGSRNPVGPTVIAEYERAGLRGDRGIEHWPKYPGCVADGLALIEALVRSADDGVHLTIHPRAKHLIAAMRSYERAKRGGQWQDYPLDPNHPHEDLVDALRGGLMTILPAGRRPQPAFRRVSSKSLL